MADVDLLMRGTAIVDGELRSATVAVEHGVVVAVEDVTWDRPAREVVELAADEVLLPGLVDTHVHVNEPGRADWEGFETATRAAAAGGITTLLDMPLNCVPPTLDVESLHLKLAVATGNLHVDVGFWGGAVPSNLGALRPLHDAMVFGFKCFLLPSGVEEFPPLDRAGLDTALREVALLDSVLLVHAEDPDVVERAPAPAGPRYADFLRSRPPESEDEAIATVVERARRHDARVHVLHLSSASALPVLAAARADGVRVTVETCPHYLTLCAEEIPDGATEFKCCPPIRSAANRDRLWAALADGSIDVVVSDHSPATVALKRPVSGDFGAAWGGISSLQLGLSLVWTEARRRGLPLTAVLRWMATRPAEIMGVAGKGRIEVGCDADLVVFAPDDTFVVDAGALHHKNPVSPYAGTQLTGVVRSTRVRGTVVTGQTPAGRFLMRGERHHA